MLIPTASEKSNNLISYTGTRIEKLSFGVFEVCTVLRFFLFINEQKKKIYKDLPRIRYFHYKKIRKTLTISCYSSYTVTRYLRVYY